MKLWGSESPKRHIAWSSSEWVQSLDLGRLRGWKSGMNPNKTARVYLDGAGRKRYVGSRHLKQTQFLNCKRKPYGNCTV